MVSSNGNKKDKSFNDNMMTWVGVPIVWGWLLAAMTIVFQGIRDPESVMPMIEGFVALLAIVGTLATLIVTSMLELWKTEQQKEVEVRGSEKPISVFPVKEAASLKPISIGT